MNKNLDDKNQHDKRRRQTDTLKIIRKAEEVTNRWISNGIFPKQDSHSKNKTIEINED